MNRKSRLYVGVKFKLCSCEQAKFKLRYTWISPKSIVGTKTAKVQLVLWQWIHKYKIRTHKVNGSLVTANTSAAWADKTRIHQNSPVTS